MEHTNDFLASLWSSPVLFEFLGQDSGSEFLFHLVSGAVVVFLSRSPFWGSWVVFPYFVGDYFCALGDLRLPRVAFDAIGDQRIFCRKGQRCRTCFLAMMSSWKIRFAIEFIVIFNITVIVIIYLLGFFCRLLRIMPSAGEINQWEYTFCKPYWWHYTVSYEGIRKHTNDQIRARYAVLTALDV